MDERPPVDEQMSRGEDVPVRRRGLREFQVALNGLRAELRAKEDSAPELAARLAFRLFQSPSGRELRRRERVMVDAADRETVGVGEDALAVYRWGDAGQTVLLSHGWDAHVGSMTPLVEALLARGFRVLSYDAPGHGASGGRRSNLRLFAAAAARMFRTYDVHAAIGHSLGAAALAIASSEPDGPSPDRLALISTPCSPRSAVARFARMLHISARVEGLLLSMVEAANERPLSYYEIDRRAAHITARVLLVHDREDTFVPLAESEKILRATRFGRLVTTTGLGHQKLLADPQVIGQCLDLL